MNNERINVKKVMLYESHQQIFCEDKITHPFFNQACADTLKALTEWFVKSDISDETIMKYTDVSKDLFTTNVKYIAEEILRINADRLNNSFGTMWFKDPTELWSFYELYNEDIPIKICRAAGENDNIISDRNFLTKFGTIYFRTLYRDFFNLSGYNYAREEPHLYSLYVILFNIYRYGEVSDSDW